MKSIKTPIHFKFDIDKFIACMSMFAEARMQDFDKLKAAKLLYFADKYHVVRYGQPIIGDVYCRLDYGPVPSRALDIINDVSENRPIAYEDGESNKDKFEEFLAVKRGLRKYPVFALKKEPNKNCLSESEQEAIKNTIESYGKYSPGQLIDKSHEDATWAKTEKNEEIDYRLFFESDPNALREALEYMESLQEDMVLSFGLSS